MKDLVSIIIPVYNVEKYLDKCIQSVLQQTYDNLEIILVDDGSTDLSGEMCDKYSKMDSRIIVIHKKNGGLSSARNTALDIMKGNFVFFLDSDDYVDKYLIEYLLEDIYKYNADIAECNFYDVYGEKLIYIDYLKKVKAYDIAKAIEIDLSSKGGSVAACGKLSKREIFADLRFREGKIGEDSFAIVDTLSRASCVVIDNRPLYYYFHRKNSISSKAFSNRTFDAIEAATYNYKKIQSQYPEAMNAAIFRYDWSRFFVVDRILLSPDWKNNKQLIIPLNHIKKNLFRILKNPYFTRNRKVGAMILMLSPMIYRSILFRRHNSNWSD